MQRTRAERIAYTKRYLAKQIKYYISYNSGVWDSGYEITQHMTGYWKRHSFADCGNGGCQMCMNPRRVKWNPVRLRITLQERRSNDSFKDQLDNYFIDICT